MRYILSIIYTTYLYSLKITYVTHIQLLMHVVKKIVKFLFLCMERNYKMALGITMPGKISEEKYGGIYYVSEQAEY